MTRRSLVLLVLIALAFVVTHALLAVSEYSEEDPPSFACRVIEVALYLAAGAVVLLDRGDDPGRSGRAAVLVVATAVVLRLMLLPTPPESTDINRYVWDGRVQAAGINPYRYIPADPALKFLRDDEIYPEINRANYAPTIYPPLAQAVFFLVTRVSETLLAMKAAMVLFEGLAAWALLRLLRRRGLPPARVLLYLWHPLPLGEIAGSGHVDAVAVACVALALLAAEARRPVWAGIALGGAVLVKFFPAVIGPALGRRWDWRLPLAGAATIALVYLPYLGVGAKIFGFLGGYSDEEGLSDGSGLYLWMLLRHLLPVPQNAFRLFLPAAALVIGALGLKIYLSRTRRGADIGAALVLAGTLSVLTSPHYPWYFLWLVPFLPFVPSTAVLYLTCASTLIYVVNWPPNFVGGSILFGPFLVLFGWDAARLLPWRADPAMPSPPEASAPASPGSP